MAGEKVTSLKLAPRGPVGDRRYMVVDADGKFITARKTPMMLSITPTLIDGGLRLAKEGMQPIELAIPAGDKRRDVSIWQDRLSAAVVEGADKWLAQALGRPASLVFMDEDSERLIANKHSRPGADVSFADAFPLLIAHQASLDDLAKRLGRPIDMRRFRPNIVVSGGEAWVEDNWVTIELDGAKFDIHSPCARCVLTTIDPATSVPDESQEPLKTLTTFRRQEGGVMFGVNALLMAGAATISATV